MAFASALKSLGHRNFRVYFWGQLVSMVGTWMQFMAQTWLVYRLTHSGALLGLVGFAGQAPAIILGLLGGSAADHFDRRRLMIWTQSAALAQAAILGFLTISGLVQVWHVFALAVLLGVINAFDMPTRQSLVVELVAREDLPNAIALNTVVINASRLIGPSAAGLLVAAYGEGPVFLLNAASYVPSIVTLSMLTLPPFIARPLPSLRQAWAHIAEGVSYAWKEDERRHMLTLLAAISFFGVPFMTLIPIFADKLGTGAAGAGWLLGASGIGAVLGSAWLALRARVVGLPAVVASGAGAFGVSLAVFAFSSSLPLSLLAMVLAGWGMMTAFVSCNMMLQARTSDAMRGRLMALFSMTFMGMSPLGSLLGGYLSDRFGGAATLGAGGAACAAAALWFWRGERATLASAGASNR